MKPLLRWIAKSGFRITLIVALTVFAYHVIAERRVLLGARPNFLQRLELTALDAKFQWRGARPPDAWHVAVAAADEKAIQAFGRLPWSRSVHAELTRRLTAMGAKVIAFDMTFSDATGGEGKLSRAPEMARVMGAKEKLVAAGLSDVAADLDALARAAEQEKDPDADFADALRASERSVLGVVAYSRLEARQVGFKELADALRLVSSSTITDLFNVGEDGLTYVLPEASRTIEEGLYRRFFGLQAPTPVLAAATPYFGSINAFPDADGVYRRVPLVSAIKGSGALVPALALKAVEVAVGPGSIEVHSGPGEAAPDAVVIGTQRVETELEAATTLDWYGPFEPSQMPIYSIADILSGKTKESEIQDRIVFVAATAIGTYDQRVTPFGAAVPGIHVHFTLAQNLLDGRHMTRPQWVLGLELLVMLAIGVLSGLIMTKLGAIGQMTMALVMAGGWLLFDLYVLFGRGLVVHPVLPLIQIGLTLLAVASWRFLLEEREKRRTRRAFGQYLAPAVMEQVLANPEEYLKLGGKRYEATVLFSDIRGFTTFSEKLTPEELGDLLNRYMTPMTNIVFAHGGTLDKYIGDAVMAFWGAPLPQPDHAVRACKAALEMMRTVDKLNVDFAQAGLPKIAIGIGLSSGPMTIGNMGSQDHFAYTALGDRVNLGSRLEGQTKEYGVDILISEDTYALVKDAMRCRELGALRVKGKLQPIRIYELIGEGPLKPEQEGFITEFHAGLAAFRGREWDEAIAAFQRARKLADGRIDKSTEEYLVWCDEYKAKPPPEDWDGVRVATSK